MLIVLFFRWYQVQDVLLQVSSLAALDVSGNQLEILPDAVAKLQHLMALNVGSNKLRALPDSLGTYHSFCNL
jgi:Leucine-rich repeat (LRR) protein